jgi:anti-anti-sigma factor
MSIKLISTKDKDTLEICIEGAFDFNLLNEFRESYQDNINEITGKPHTNYIVNLRSTTSIDSSALGMLLNMKRALGKNDREIRISHCQPQVLKILTISRFDKKFFIE